MEFENKIWKILENRKCLCLNFRKCHIINGFIVDFFCNEIDLIIEIKGSNHQKQKNYDLFRQSLLKKGINIVVISKDEVEKDIKILLRDSSYVYLNFNMTSPLAPLLKERGMKAGMFTVVIYFFYAI